MVPSKIEKLRQWTVSGGKVDVLVLNVYIHPKALPKLPDYGGRRGRTKRRMGRRQRRRKRETEREE